MSWFSSSKEKSRQGSSRGDSPVPSGELDYAALGLDPALFRDVPDIGTGHDAHDEFPEDMEDVDDAALAAELADLLSDDEEVSAPPKTKPQQTKPARPAPPPRPAKDPTVVAPVRPARADPPPKPAADAAPSGSGPDVDVDTLVDQLRGALDNPEANEEEVDFTEDDMNDPELKAALKALGGDISDDETVEEPKPRPTPAAPAGAAAPTRPPRTEITAAKNVLEDFGDDIEDEEGAKVPAGEETTRQKLQRQAKESREQARKFLSEGRKEDAKKALLHAKQLEARLSGPGRVTPGTSPKSKDGKKSAPTAAGGRVEKPRSVPVAKISELEEAYKCQAVAAKQSGHNAAAREAFLVYKKLEAMRKQASQGKVITEDALPDPPKPLKTAVSSTAGAYGIPAHGRPQTSSKNQPSPRNSGQRTGSGIGRSNPTKLKKVLHAQQEKAKQQYAAHRAAKNEDAMSKFKIIYQSMGRQLDALSKCTEAGISIPTFSPQSISLPTFKVCADVHPSELELSIMRGQNLPLASGYETDDLETLIRWEFPFPDSENPQVGKTNVGLSVNPIYEYHAKLKIARNRAMERFLQRDRRGINLQVLSYKGWGPFKKEFALGSIELKLGSLQTNAVLHEVMALTDGRRPLSHGKIEVKIRVNQPIGPPVARDTIDSWISSENLSALLEQQSLKAPVPATGAQKSPSASPTVARKGSPSPTTGMQRKSTGSSSPASPSPVASPAPGADADAEEYDKFEFFPPDIFMSNAIMESEMAECDQLIVEARKKGETNDDAETRKMLLEGRANMLVTAVQIGQLTPEKYLETLQDEMGKFKTLALEYKKAGNRKAALQSVQYMKLVETEIQSIQSEEM
eukprot:Clim_evm21s109 gene=Clim_evmTU21s109